MPNPNKPNYGRLQIDTTDKVKNTASQVQTDKGRDGVGGMQSGGFKFAQDARSAYDTPQSLLDPILDNAAGLMKSTADMLETSEKWSRDFDKAIQDDMDLEYNELINSDLYLGTELEEDRATMVDGIYSKFDDHFVTDTYKDKHKVRRMQSGAATRMAKGSDVIYAFEQELAAVANLPAAERIEMLVRYEEAGADILDPRLKAKFEQSKRTAQASIATDWQAKHTEAVAGFKSWASTVFPTREAILAHGPTDRESFISTTKADYISTFRDNTDEQRAIAEQMLESIAGDQWDVAQFATGDIMSLEKNKIVAMGVDTRDTSMVLSVIAKQDALKGIKVLSNAISTATFEDPRDIPGYAKVIARDLMGENPEIMQDFLRGVPSLPEGTPPELVALHAAAQRSNEDFGAMFDKTAFGFNGTNTLDLVHTMYAQRVTSALTGTKTRNGGAVGSPPPSNEEKALRAAEAARAGSEAEILADLGLPEGTFVHPDRIAMRTFEKNSAPSAGQHLSPTIAYDEDTTPSLMNAVASLPAGPEKERALVALSNADRQVADYFDQMIAEGGADALAEGGFLTAYQTYKAGLLSFSLGGTPLAPGALASELDRLPGKGSEVARASVVNGLQALKGSLLKTKFYDNTTGFRITQDHDEASTFGGQYSQRNYADLAEAKTSNYYKSTSAAISQLKSSKLFNEDGSVDFEALKANPQIPLIGPNLMASMASNPHHPGVRDLTQQLIGAMYPPHVQQLYSTGTPVLRTAIETMTSGFFQRTQDVNAENLGSFVEDFTGSLDMMMANSSKPAVRAKGLETIGEVSSFSLNRLTQRDLDFMGGTSTLHENEEGYWFPHITKGDEDMSSKEAPEATWDEVLQRRYPETKLMENEEERRADQKRRFKADVDTQMSSSLVEAALRDESFRSVLMFQLTQDGDPRDALNASVASWMSGRNLTVALVPNDVPSSGAVLNEAENDTVGQALIGFSIPDSPMKFQITSSPITRDLTEGPPAPGSFRFVDGTSEYSDSMNPNSEHLFFDGDKAGAIGTTNMAARTFLTKDDAHKLQTELSTKLSTQFGAMDEQEASSFAALMSGAEVTSQKLRRGGPSAHIEMGINPRHTLESLRGLRQYSAERAIAIMAFTDSIQPGQYESATEALVALKAILPADMSFDNSTRGNTVRKSLFHLKTEPNGTQSLELQAADIRISITNPERMLQIRKMLNEGSTTPVIFWPGEEPEPLKVRPWHRH